MVWMESPLGAVPVPTTPTETSATTMMLVGALWIIRELAGLAVFLAKKKNGNGNGHGYPIPSNNGAVEAVSRANGERLARLEVEVTNLKSEMTGLHRSVHDVRTLLSTLLIKLSRGGVSPYGALEQAAAESANQGD